MICCKSWVVTTFFFFRCGGRVPLAVRLFWMLSPDDIEDLACWQHTYRRLGGRT